MHKRCRKKGASGDVGTEPHREEKEWPQPVWPSESSVQESGGAVCKSQEEQCARLRKQCAKTATTI